MAKRVLETPSAPAALGPYSVAVEAGGLVFISGQVAIDPATGDRAPDDVAAQTGQIMANVGAILGDIGLGFPDVVKTTIFLANMADFPIVNEVYGKRFEGDAPARATVEVAALPGGFLVEIEVVASR
ncbi:MAG TPA: reactive intermediate/imine deaminase [Actinobacteria bacterium]|nr:enamine/imine deaminase [bacterium BMS3Bbin01]HDH25897.1 reactive intermediate/imine deaminase [Actinomycetota bacterium]